MTTAKFATNYLTETANVCIHFGNGDIYYEGPVGDAPYGLLKHTELLNLDGLGMKDDIFLCVDPTEEFWTWYSKYLGAI